MGPQLVMGLALLPLAVLDPVSAFGWFGWLVPLLLVHGMLQ